jgi:basic amino acid/polyamine antiporter, APA family
MQGGNKMSDNKLAKGISPVAMWAAASGMLIGPWIMVTPWFFSLTGSSIVLSLTICAALMIPIGLVYAELVSMLPSAGGSYHYTSNAFGTNAGFGFAWMITLAYNGLIAFNITAPIYILQMVGWLPQTELVRIGGAILVALVFAFINSRKVELSGSIQTFMTVLLVVGGLVVNGVLLFCSGHWTTDNLTPFYATGMPGFLLSIGLLSNLYFGFEAIPQLVEEAKYPVKKNPKILLLAIGTAWVVYFVALLGIAGSAPWTWITEHPLAAADVMTLTWGQTAIGLTGFAIAAIIGILGAATGFNGFWLAITRLYYALGRAKAFPKAMGTVNRFQVPGIANLVCMIIVLFLIIFSGSSWIQVLYVLMTLAITIVYVGDMLAFMVLRFKKPQWKRPFKLPGGITIGILGLAAAGYCVYYCAFATDVRGWILFGGYVVVGAAILIANNAHLKRIGEKPEFITQEKVDETSESLQKAV